MMDEEDTGSSFNLSFVPFSFACIALGCWTLLLLPVDYQASFNILWFSLPAAIAHFVLIRCLAEKQVLTHFVWHGALSLGLLIGASFWRDLPTWAYDSRVLFVAYGFIAWLALGGIAYLSGYCYCCPPEPFDDEDGEADDSLLYDDE